MRVELAKCRKKQKRKKKITVNEGEQMVTTDGDEKNNKQVCYLKKFSTLKTVKMQRSIVMLSQS